MKRTRIGAITLLMIILSSCATLVVATPITTLGTLDYYNTEDNFCIIDDIPGNADLTLVYSGVEGNAIELDKIWFNSATNLTTYKFTTQKIYVDWWFVPDIRQFVFLDENNNELYEININYSAIDIPENPYTIQYQQLMENYTLILENYNLTNSSLANITMQFDEITILYTSIMDQYNTTQKDYLVAFENLTDLTTAFTDLEDEHNNTNLLWRSAANNVSYFQTQYEGLMGSYSQLKQDHDDLTGATPWYIIIGFIGAFLFAFVYLRRKTIFDPKPEVTDEISTGYGKLHATIDKYVLSRLRGNQKVTEEAIGEIKEVMPKDETQYPEETVSADVPLPTEKIKEVSIPDKTDDILTIVTEKMDANNRALNLKVKNMFSDVEKKLKDMAKD